MNNEVADDQTQKTLWVKLEHHFKSIASWSMSHFGLIHGRFIASLLATIWKKHILLTNKQESVFFSFCCLGVWLFSFLNYSAVTLMNCLLSLCKCWLTAVMATWVVILTCQLLFTESCHTDLLANSSPSLMSLLSTVCRRESSYLGIPPNTWEK